MGQRSDLGSICVFFLRCKNENVGIDLGDMGLE